MSNTGRGKKKYAYTSFSAALPAPEKHRKKNCWERKREKGCFLKTEIGRKPTADFICCQTYLMQPVLLPFCCEIHRKNQIECNIGKCIALVLL